MLTISEEGAVEQNKLGYVEIQSKVVEQVVGDSVIESDKLFFKSFHFTECIQQHSKIQSLIKNKIRICSPAQLLFFQAPLTIFANF